MCWHKQGTQLEIRLDLQFGSLFGLSNDKACMADVSLQERKKWIYVKRGLGFRDTVLQAVSAVGEQLDQMKLEIFSNLSDSVTLWLCPVSKTWFLTGFFLSKQKVMIWTSIMAVLKCIKGSTDKRMLFSKTAGTLPVSSHNWVLQYLNYKLKIIFTGVILNIIWNFLTLPQPRYTTQLHSDLHVWCTWLKFCHITSWATKTHSINRRCNIWESKNT